MVLFFGRSFSFLHPPLAGPGPAGAGGGKEENQTTQTERSIYMSVWGRGSGGCRHFVEPFGRPPLFLLFFIFLLDKDPTGPEWTQSGGKTNSVTYLLTRAYDEEKKNFGGYDELLTAAYALQAYIMLQEAGLGDIEGDGPPTGGGGSGGGQTPGGKDPTGEFRVQVKVVGKDGTVLFGPQTVTIDDDNPWGGRPWVPSMPPDSVMRMTAGSCGKLRERPMPA